MNQITKLHRAEASNYRWRDKFFEGSKAVRLTNASCNRNTRSTLILKRHARFVDGSGNLSIFLPIPLVAVPGVCSYDHQRLYE